MRRNGPRSRSSRPNSTVRGASSKPPKSVSANGSSIASRLPATPMSAQCARGASVEGDLQSDCATPPPRSLAKEP